MSAKSSTSCVLVWFRDDLRLADNPALSAAAADGAAVACVYVHDTLSPGLRPAGGASRWWRHHSLMRLDEGLANIGGALRVEHGAAEDIVVALALSAQARAVFWNRRPGAAEAAVDAAVAAKLQVLGIEARACAGDMLREPSELRTGSGAGFKVFTPFWKAHRGLGDPPPPLPAPTRLVAGALSAGPAGAIRIAALGLLPTAPDWSGGLAAAWTPGEAGARARLAAFLDSGAKDYARLRDRPDQPATSRLAPHMHFGEISARAVFHAVRAREASGEIAPADAAKFLAEVGWREFCRYMLHHFPKLGTDNVQARFDRFPWHVADPRMLRAWQRGRTGYPIVDAGMRELWHTGFMHNRVRMICASFLTKHLLIDWRIGEAWFWDTLCCADLASNAANWQWVAGSGADAAPYFRIFNPVLQGQTFDPNGTYIRRFVPELASVDSLFVHTPWLAPVSSRPADYPAPVVDHQFARRRALDAFSFIRTAAILKPVKPPARNSPKSSR